MVLLRGLEWCKRMRTIKGTKGVAEEWKKLGIFANSCGQVGVCLVVRQLNLRIVQTK
jgi:hypothetical protein